jgi:SWI/SNF-related matrix-associated actin-dependent regulator 1 of chromatin subfamily A
LSLSFALVPSGTSSSSAVWPAEIEKFFPSIPPQSIYVAAGFSDIGFTKQKDVRIVIVTYSLLQQRSAVANVLQDMNFNCIICDESHNLKQKNSQRSKLILPLLSRARNVVLLSGTPALARPVELWTQLSCLAPKVFGNWTAFTNKYCNPKRKFIGGRVTMDYSGSSNEAELHEKLKNVMLRRLKCDVLSELPPKQRSIIPVTISREEKEKCRQAMAEMGDKRESIQDLFGDDARQADWEAKSKMMAAYQQSGIGKAQAVADYVVDWLAGSDTQKILVFAHHRAVLDAVDQRLLAKYPNSHIRIDGQVPTGARAQLVRKFQTCARVRVALLSMTAAGVGLTLTAASTVLFSELHWTPGVLAQAEDRAHRIGQTHDSVQINYMVCKDESLSLDMTMWKMLGKKIGTLGQVVDGNKVRTLTLASVFMSFCDRVQVSRFLFTQNRILLIFIRRRKV